MLAINSVLWGRYLTYRFARQNQQTEEDSDKGQCLAEDEQATSSHEGPGADGLPSRSGIELPLGRAGEELGEAGGVLGELIHDGRRFPPMRAEWKWGRVAEEGELRSQVTCKLVVEEKFWLGVPRLGATTEVP